MNRRNRTKMQSLSSRILGEFAYFENGQHRVVQVFNKRQMFQQLMELEEQKPWIGSYRYTQTR